MEKHSYSDFERYIIVNVLDGGVGNLTDSDLAPIKIDVLDVIQRTYKMYGMNPPSDFPDIKKIDGYGLPPEEQYFRREEYPKKLELLEKRIRARKRKSRDTLIKREIETINLLWEILSEEREKYRDEIRWIRRMWYYRLFGYWCFINGKPTYIAGPHWFYLNFWYLRNILPEYRDRDRRWWIAQNYALTDTKTFANLDQKGFSMPDYNGEYEMIELGRRVCFGTNNPKSRRVGDTSKSQCNNFEAGSRTHNVHIGIQGKDDDNARNVFITHLIAPFKKLPIIWKPLMEQLDPRNELIFDNEDPELGLQTRFDFATTADRSAYDGYQLFRYHRDEPGKIKNEDILKSHLVTKNSLALGDEIIGFMEYTTTVDEMNRRGGENFLKLTLDSHWNHRNANGQTESGLYNIFFPAYDGFQGFVGPYGESVIFDPTPEQEKFIGKNYGAWEYQRRKRESLKKQKKIEQLSEEKRLFPWTFRECFTPPAANIFFRMDILEERITDLQFKSETVRGNFAWINKSSFTVGWFADEEGRFEISYFPPKDKVSRFRVIDGVKIPVNRNGVISADAFRLEKTEGGRMSDGGISGFLMHDKNVDPDTKDVKDWSTHRFCLDYRYRPETTDEYAEDVLMAAIYLGFYVYPENNIDLIQRKFIEWGFEGFLLFDVDVITGELKNNAGFFSGTQTVPKLFNLMRDYIKIHGKREKHLNILRECIEIPSRDKMTDYDLFTASCGCLMAVDSMTILKEYEQEDDIRDVSGWLKSNRM